MDRTERTTMSITTIVFCITLATCASSGLILTASAKCFVDEPPKAAPTETAPDSAAGSTDRSNASSAAAAAIVERAVRAQRGATLEGAIVDIQGTFEVISYEDGHKLEADVKQAYLSRDGKEYYLSSVRDRTQKKTVSKGFDGRDYWLKDGKNGRFLRSRGDRADRTAIDREIEDIKRNLRYLFLANLDGEGVRFESVGTHPDSLRDSVAVRRVAPNERSSVLFFGEKESRLLRVVLEKESADTPQVRIDFFSPGKKTKPTRCRQVFRAGKLAEDLWVPQQMIIYHDDAKKPLHDFFLNEIRINSSLDPKKFKLEKK